MADPPSVTPPPYGRPPFSYTPSMTDPPSVTLPPYGRPPLQLHSLHMTDPPSVTLPPYDRPPSVTPPPYGRPPFSYTPSIDRKVDDNSVTDPLPATAADDLNSENSNLPYELLPAKTRSRPKPFDVHGLLSRAMTAH